MKKQIVYTQEDPEGNIIITIPPSFLKKLGWNEETMVDIKIEDDGVLVITKV